MPHNPRPDQQNIDPARPEVGQPGRPVDPVPVKPIDDEMPAPTLGETYEEASAPPIEPAIEDKKQP